MRRFLSGRVVCGVAVLLAAGAVLLMRQRPAFSEEKATVDEAAIARARDTVHMLDDIHKNYVVQITATYVKAQETTPAAKVTKKVFAAAEEKGWHAGRLLDATGEPLNKANAPKSDFEKRAIDKIKGGKAYYDEVGEKNGKPVLRAATIVPVVMDQCIVCHPGHKKGELLGALVYEVPIK
jgi:hypothetical protein